MALKMFFILTAAFLVSFIQVSFSQRGSSTDNYTLIKNRIDTLNFQASQTAQLYPYQSKEAAEQALYLAEKIQYIQGQAEAYESIGLFYSGRSEFVEALKCFSKFVDLEKQAGNVDGEIMGNLRIAAIYLKIKNLERAEQYLSNANLLLGVTQSDRSIGMVNVYYGLYYYEMKENLKALEVAANAFEKFSLIQDVEMCGRTEKLFGDLYIEMGRLDDAIQAYEKSIGYFSKTNLALEMGNLLTRIGHVYQLQGDLNAVLDYNFQALRKREENGHLIFISHSLVNISKTYSMMGRNDSALSYLKRGLDVAKKSGDNYVIQNAYYNLSALYETLNNYREALKFSQLYIESYNKYLEERTKSEIYSFEVNSQIREIEAQNQVLQQKLEIQNLELKNRSYSELITQLIIGTIGLLFLIMIYIIERNKLGKSRLKMTNAALNREVKERRLKEVQLKTSEELYRFVTEHTLDLIVRMDRRFNYIFISPSVLRMFGYQPHGADILPAIREIIPSEFHRELEAQYKEMIRTGKPVMLTHQSIRKDGSVIWSESLVNPIFDDRTGKLKETITVIREITERVAYEESLAENARQKELLLREIHHRVKNNFAILISLMNMQKAGSDPRDFNLFLTELQGRIRTMSLVHELLYRTFDIDCINFREYLGQLITIVSRAYRDNPVKIHTSITPCILDVEIALPLGLIANEILTNAFKYAFTDRTDGELRVELDPLTKERSQDGKFSHILTFRDNGPGLPEGFSAENRNSMGSQIIRLLVDQLEGRLEVANVNGAMVTIYFSDEKRS